MTEPKVKTETETQADLMWKKISNLTLDLYSLPNQVVNKHVTRKNVLPDCLHLTLKSSAVLPALEIAMQGIKMPKGEKYVIEEAHPFIVIKKVIDLSNLPD